MIVQGIFALLAAASVVWILSDGIFPTIDATINELPDQGQIRSGTLDWHDESPLLLAEGNLLAFSNAAHEYLGMLYYRMRGWM